MAVTGPLSPRQTQSLRESTGRVNLWEGSVRSGKTLASLLRFVLAVNTADGVGEIVIVGRTRESIWRNVIGPLQTPELFGPIAAQVIGNHGAPTVAILGRRVHVIGASDAKAEATIRGMTVLYVYADEVTVLPEAFFTQLLARMSPPAAQMFATTNPDSPAHWVRRRFLDRLDALPSWRTWRFTLDDNPSLTPGYIASLKAEYTGLWYRRFILGEWVAAEGAVYSMWDPDMHVIPAARLPRMDRLIGVGIDHGMTNPTAGVLLGYAAGRLYAVDELWLDATGPTKLTVPEQTARTRAWMSQHPGIEWVVVDPAAAAYRTQLWHEGITAHAATNTVSYGIQTVAGLLSRRRLLISDACPNLIREIPGYAWDDKATERGEDTPVKVADHALDALRYAIASTEIEWRSLLPDHEPA